MTMSCSSTDLEKQIVLRASRLMRVRSVRCLRSIWGVLPNPSKRAIPAFAFQDLSDRHLR